MGRTLEEQLVRVQTQKWRAAERLNAYLEKERKILQCMDGPPASPARTKPSTPEYDPGSLEAHAATLTRGERGAITRLFKGGKAHYGVIAPHTIEEIAARKNCDIRAVAGHLIITGELEKTPELEKRVAKYVPPEPVIRAHRERASTREESSLPFQNEARKLKQGEKRHISVIAKTYDTSAPNHLAEYVANQTGYPLTAVLGYLLQKGQITPGENLTAIIDRNTNPLRRAVRPAVSTENPYRAHSRSLEPFDRGKIQNMFAKLTQDHHPHGAIDIIAKEMHVDARAVAGYLIDKGEIPYTEELDNHLDAQTRREAPIRRTRRAMKGDPSKAGNVLTETLNKGSYPDQLHYWRMRATREFRDPSGKHPDITPEQAYERLVKSGMKVKREDIFPYVAMLCGRN